jgi:hypothetical protein
MDEPKYETDVQVWEDPDMDGIVIENMGGIQFTGDNMLIVVDHDENVVMGFNKDGWLKFEITKRVVTDQPVDEGA